MIKVSTVQGTPKPWVTGSAFMLELIGGWVAFEGSIFNRNRRQFPTDADLVKEVFQFGMPERDLKLAIDGWDGPFAVVYYDNKSGALHCWTDPLGQKTLYYRKNRASYPDVCTNIIPLVKDLKAFDLLYKSCTFKFGYNYDDRTPWVDVKRVMPNTIHTFRHGGNSYLTEEAYFDWFRDDKTEDPRDLVERLYMAVNDRLNTGNRVGILMSGGLDSSIIAAIIDDLEDMVEAYTINNGEDLPFAKEMAEHLGWDLKILEYEVDADMRPYFRVNETPVDLGSVIPNQKMFSLIDTPVLFTGDGADELFGGYRRIDDYDSQMSDVFQELSFYHLPRLARAAEHYEKDLRSPFLSLGVIKEALKLPYDQRTHKWYLKNAFGPMLPKSIINRPKLPLKNDVLRNDPMSYRKQVYNMFYNENIFGNENL